MTSSNLKQEPKMELDLSPRSKLQKSDRSRGSIRRWREEVGEGETRLRVGEETFNFSIALSRTRSRPSNSTRLRKCVGRPKGGRCAHHTSASVFVSPGNVWNILKLFWEPEGDTKPFSSKDHKRSGCGYLFIRSPVPRGAEMKGPKHMHERPPPHHLPPPTHTRAHTHPPVPPWAAVSSVSHVWRSSQQWRRGEESGVCRCERRSPWWKIYIGDTPCRVCVCVCLCALKSVHVEWVKYMCYCDLQCSLCCDSCLLGWRPNPILYLYDHPIRRVLALTCPSVQGSVRVFWNLKL